MIGTGCSGMIGGSCALWVGELQEALICAETPGQRGSVDWLNGTFLVVAWPRRTAAGVKVERPQQRKDERPWRRRRGGACLAGQGGWSTSAQAVHPLTAAVVIGVCVRAPSLIWVHEPIRVRRQDDRWGCPRGARPRGLLGPSTDQPWRQGLSGRWPRHICLPMGGHAPAMGQAASGRGRPSTGASAPSPSATRVWRTRRASLRATARVARLPPWRTLTCW
jgi:hypothetical protein